MNLEKTFSKLKTIHKELRRINTELIEADSRSVTPIMRARSEDASHFVRELKEIIREEIGEDTALELPPAELGTDVESQWSRFVHDHDLQQVESLRESLNIVRVAQRVNREQDPAIINREIENLSLIARANGYHHAEVDCLGELDFFHDSDGRDLRVLVPELPDSMYPSELELWCGRENLMQEYNELCIQLANAHAWAVEWVDVSYGRLNCEERIDVHGSLVANFTRIGQVRADIRAATVHSDGSAYFHLKNGDVLPIPQPYGLVYSAEDWGSFCDSHGIGADREALKNSIRNCQANPLDDFIQSKLEAHLQAFGILAERVSVNRATGIVSYHSELVGETELPLNRGDK